MPERGDDAIERLVRLGPRNLTWPEACERAGVPHEVADLLWRALGFADVPAEERAYTEEDVRALAIAAEGVDSLEGEARSRAVEAIVQEARMVSAHLTHVAEIEADSLALIRELGLREGALMEALDLGIERSRIGWLLLYAFRRRLDEALRRRSDLSGDDDAVAAVGFVDLVGFARTSGELEPAALGDLLGRFESLAFDTVTEAGGRVVKLIGDEAMLMCPHPAQAARAALDMIGACASEGMPPARGGLALGPLLFRAGDAFGRPVNLASRLVGAAAPGTVLADERLAGGLEADPELRVGPLGSTPLRGFGEVPLWRIERC